MGLQNLKIRIAELKDATDIQPLLKALEYPATLQQVEERLITYNSLDYMVLVAELEKVIQGVVAMSFSELFVSQTKKAHIEALIVSDTSRGKGIGKALLTTAEKIARKRGCKLIDLTSGKRRKPKGSHDFYANLGYGNNGHWAKEYFRKDLTTSR